MTTPNNSCQWEKRSQQEKDDLKDRFNGARYSFRGCEHWGPSDIVPQNKGLFPFPKDDAEQIGPVKGYEDPN